MSEILKSLSDALAEAAQNGGQSVVRVEGRRRMPASGIVWSADGLIITAHHVVEKDENIHIGLPDGKTATASLVGRDPTTDLAILRSDAKGLKAPALAEPDSLKAGQLVLALGRPGDSIQATLGVVSALGDTWRTPGGGLIEHYLQTDVTMYPGFSGGPLVGAGGEVMGLNTSALLRGVSLAIPIPALRRIAEALLKHGRMRRGYLGIGAQPVRLPDTLRDQLKQETGLLIMSVEKGSPAEKGGLLLGDTIVAFGDEPVRDMDDLLAFLSGDRVGASVQARVVRGGQVQEFSLVIGERE